MTPSDLLAIIRRNLYYRDLTRVSQQTGESLQYVSQVFRGKIKHNDRAKRVISALLKRAESNKKILDKAAKFLNA
jgi:hypothetical protein